MKFTTAALMTALLLALSAQPAHAEGNKQVEQIQELALAGNAKAQFQLAVMYEEGRGVKRDIAYALSWYEEAARNGLKLASHRLKMLTEQ